MAHRGGITYEWNKGSRNGNAKIDEAKVLEIRALLSVAKRERLKHQDIATQLGVSLNTVRKISSGFNWKEVRL